MKKTLVLLFLISLLNISFLYSQDIITKDIQAAFTPQSALDSLKKGNLRFVNETQIHRNLLQEAELTAEKQFPFAVILNCLDSRTSAEIVFDQGMGSIFNARIAGNIVNDDIIGSMEFACKLMGSKLIAIIGHNNCGAIKGACDGAKLGNLTTVLDKIQPAISEVKNSGDRTSKNEQFVQDVAIENVINGIQIIKERSPILKEMIDNGEIGIVGGMYDLNTGRVTFYED